MSKTYELECNGQRVTLERTASGDIVFHDYDEETDLVMEALGAEPSGCMYIRRILERASIEGEEFLDKTLLDAAFDGHIDKLPLLVFIGADINVKGGEAIASAARNDDYETVKALAVLGANPNAEEGTPLAVAIIRKELDLARFLIGYGADINLSGAIVHAAETDDAAVVRFVLDYGADPTINDNSALAEAINNGNLGMFEMLVVAGAEMPSRGLQISFDTHITDEMIDLIYDEFDISDANGRDALENAVMLDRLDLVKALLYNGVPFDPEDDEMMEIARDQDCDEIAEYLEQWQDGLR